MQREPCEVVLKRAHWVVGGGPQNKGVAIAFGGDDANAHLIAAAPDLLESARRIVSGVHSEYRIHADADDDYIHDTIGTALSDAYFSARAAIAKAEGRS